MPVDTSTWIAETLAVFAKEWRCELRTRTALSTIALFACTTLLVVSFALGPLGASHEGRTVLPALLWTILLFAASAGLPRAFVREEEMGTAAALRLTTSPSAVFTGKALYNLTLIFGLELLVVPLFLGLLQMNVDRPWALASVLAAGGAGLAIGSTLVAAMVAQAQVKGPLFAVLAFPVLLPLLFFAIRLTLGAVDAAAPGGVEPTLLLLYDATLTVAALMLFPLIWSP